MNYELTFSGMSEDQSFREMFEKKINQLLEVAPSDANAESKIMKKRELYAGVLRIFSSQGKFIVSATAKGLDELSKSLMTQMYEHMKRWRLSRSIEGDKASDEFQNVC